MPIAFDRVSVEGEWLIATGKATLMQEVDVSLVLDFANDSFAGKLDLPPFGTMTYDGYPGEGPSLSEGLAQELAQYRKTGMTERTDAEKLLRRMSNADKVGQMSQCMASSFSFGEDVASDPPEKLVAEGKAGSILGAFDIERVFELQRIAVEQSPHRIPLLFNNDIIHGHQTIFPVPLAWSCSWDMDAIRRACAIAAKEAFQAGISAGADPVMNSFNVYQGVPVAGNKYLLKDLLRDKLGFDGMLISDYGAVDEIRIHGCA